MKFVLPLLLVSSVLLIVGCSLSPEETARLDALTVDNERLLLQIQGIVAKAKDGTLTIEEARIAVESVWESVKKNKEEIELLRENGGSMAPWIFALLGIFGRSFLHFGSKAASPFPASGLVQGLFGFLLGGSKTNKEESVNKPSESG